MHTVKPLDKDALLKAASECGALVTVEEHTVVGGLGGAVSEYLTESCPVPVLKVGVQDTFGESGEPEEILEKYGLTSEEVIKKVRKVLTLK